MKKRKITYSLTAQQKKKLKRGEPIDGSKKDTEELPNGEGAAAKKKVNTTLIICIVAAVLAVVLIFLAIFIPLKMNSEIITKNTFINWKNNNPKDPDNPYSVDNPNPNVPNNPIATITLTGDDQNAFKTIFGDVEVQLSYEIFMDDAPYAGVNFMYLALSGFYDGTIISDIHRGFAKMSGFTDKLNSSNRALDAVFVRALKGFNAHTVNTTGSSNYKLGYRLNAESARSALNSNMSSFGYLLMMAGSSSSYSTSTTFMMTVRDDPQFNFADENTPISSYISWVGRVIINDEKSVEILRKLGDENVVSTKLDGNSYCPQTNIRIKSIDIDLSSAKKKYLMNNFEDIIEDGLAVTTWRTIAYNADSYKFGQ